MVMLDVRPIKKAKPQSGLAFRTGDVQPRADNRSAIPHISICGKEIL
jgi:hypothetical protein